MKIKDIKDPKVQQMAIINAINENPELHLEHIMNYLLKNAFIWAKAPQGSRFWQSVSEMKPYKYSEFGLFFKSTQSIFKQQIDNLEFRCANDLATPEEVYNHLKQEAMNNPTYGKNTINKQEEPKIQKDASTLQEPQERESTRFLLKGAIDKIIILEEEKKDLTSKINNINNMISCSNKGFQSKIKELEDLNTELKKERLVCIEECRKIKDEKIEVLVERKELAAQNEKLNTLVDDIESICEDQTNARMKLNAIHRLIYLYRKPSIIGTTRKVDIDGVLYNVEVKSKFE